MLKCLNVKTNKKGFTILEVMMATFVIIVGMLGVMTLLQRAIVSTSISSSRFQAVYLAQEGVEIVRNVRDANWLEARTAENSWDEGLAVCPGSGFIIDYNHSYGPSQLDPGFPCYTGQFLNIDTNGFYSYSAGQPTKFQRKITTNVISADRLNVQVEIFWQERGESFSFSVEEQLYNWH